MATGPYRAYRKPHIPDLHRVADVLSRTAGNSAVRAIGDLADDKRAEFQRKIREQDFVSFERNPLTRAYVERKEREGLDERVMIATGHYVRSIAVREVPMPRRQHGWHIGFREGERAQDKDGNPVEITLNRLAIIHEYGSAKANIPARKHWRPMLAGIRREARQLRSQLRSLILKRTKRLLPGAH